MSIGTLSVYFILVQHCKHRSHAWHWSAVSVVSRRGFNWSDYCSAPRDMSLFLPLSPPRSPENGAVPCSHPASFWRQVDIITQ